LGINNGEYIIWDPCCGSLNAICSVFDSKEFVTKISDVQELNLNDFMQMSYTEIEKSDVNGTMIVTNPPWSQNKKFLTKLVELNVPFCCLLKMDVMGNKYFSEILSSASKDRVFHALPLSKGKFYCVQTGNEIQMASIFWLICDYIPKGYVDALKQSEEIRTCPVIMKSL
jgi:hypothetical protein